MFENSWVSPLLLLPGVGLLVMSTAARFAVLHQELHHLETHGPDDRRQLLKTLVHRARLFRDALVGLYSSAALLAVASLAAGLTLRWTELSMWMVLGFTALAIAGLVFACVQLVRELMGSLHIIHEHARDTH